MMEDHSDIKLWLDDVRPAPEGWTWAKNIEEAKEILLQGNVVEASLDHDLGFIADPNHEGDWHDDIQEFPNPAYNVSAEGADGIDLVKWMCEHDVFPEGPITIHSWNPIGANNMALLLKEHSSCEIHVVPYRVS